MFKHTNGIFVDKNTNKIVKYVILFAYIKFILYLCSRFTNNN